MLDNKEELIGQKGKNIMYENDLLKEEVLKRKLEMEEWAPMSPEDVQIATNAATPCVCVTSVDLSNSSLNMNVNNSYLLKACVYPTNATNKAITWSSSNTNVATVTNGGLVCARRAGSTTITVKSNDGGYTKTCQVYVIGEITCVTDLSLSESTLTLETNETYLLTATVAPENADNKKVKWTSSDTNVARISSGGMICTKNPGICTITAMTMDGSNITETCELIVNPAPGWVGASLQEKTSITTIDKEFDLSFGLGILKVAHTQTVTRTKVNGSEGDILGVYAYSDYNINNFAASSEYGVGLELLSILNFEIYVKWLGIGATLSIGELFYINLEINLVDDITVSIGHVSYAENGDEVDDNFSIKGNLIAALTIASAFALGYNPNIKPVFQPS